MANRKLFDVEAKLKPRGGYFGAQTAPEMSFVDRPLGGDDFCEYPYKFQQETKIGKILMIQESKNTSHISAILWEFLEMPSAETSISFKFYVWNLQVCCNLEEKPKGQPLDAIFSVISQVNFPSPPWLRM